MDDDSDMSWWVIAHQDESFGDINDDPIKDMIDHLPNQLRSRCCHPDEPWVSSTSHDHGHTDCLLMNLAADEIERLRGGG